MSKIKYIKLEHKSIKFKTENQQKKINATENLFFARINKTENLQIKKKTNNTTITEMIEVT